MAETINTKTYSKINPENRSYTFQAKLHGEDIAKIVAVSTHPAIKKYENANNLTVAGQAKVDVLYENTEGALRSISDMIDFNASLEQAKGEHLSLTCKEVETSAELLQGSEIIISSVFDIEIEGVESTDIIAPMASAEYFNQLKTIEYQSLAATSDDKIVVVDECEISASSILKSDAVLTITKVSATEDALLVDGELLVSICSEIDNNPKTTFKRIEFSSEVAALGAKASNTIDYSASIESFTAILANEGTNGALTISATIKFNALCFNNSALEVIEDVYSTSRELIVTTTGTYTQKFIEKEYTEKDCSVVLSAKDKNINMGTVLAVVSPLLVKGQNNTGVECTVVYRHAETDKIESVVLEGELNYDLPACDVIIKSFTKRKAKEVEVELSLIEKTYKEESSFSTYVSNIEEGEEIEPDNKAIVIYQATIGQSLFSIAKALKVDPETLLLQNSDLENVMPTDRKVILYKKSVATF